MRSNKVCARGVWKQALRRGTPSEDFVATRGISAALLRAHSMDELAACVHTLSEFLRAKGLCVVMSMRTCHARTRSANTKQIGFIELFILALRILVLL